MNTDDKFQLASKLKIDIDNIKDFIEQIDNRQGIYKKDKVSQFKHLELETGIWTGSDTCRNTKTLRGNDIIKGFVNSGLSYLKEELAKKEIQYNNLFK